MLKKANVFALLLILVSFSFTNNVSASPNNYDSMTDAEILILYEPYQSMLNSLNEKYGTTVQIIDNDYLYSVGMTKRDVYIQTISKSMDDFRTEIITYINDMAELKNIAINGSIDLDNTSNLQPATEKAEQKGVSPYIQSKKTPNYQTSESKIRFSQNSLSVEPRMVPVMDVQHYMLSKGGGIFLKSMVSRHPTLNYSMYSDILGCGTVDSPDGSNFKYQSARYEKSSDSRICKVTATGMHISSSGYCDLVLYTYSYAFEAGAYMPWR